MTIFLILMAAQQKYDMVSGILAKRVGPTSVLNRTD